MRFFKYNSNENIGRIWSLFSHMAEAQINQTDFGMACDYSHTLEIVNAAMSGSISLDYESIESFNLEGYEYACSKNDKIRRLQKRNKELFIVDSFDSDDEEGRLSYGDVSSNEVAIKTYKNVKNELDSIVNDIAFNTSLKELLQIRNKTYVEYGIDIVVALVSAIQGMKGAVDNIRMLVEKNETLGEIITSLCEAGNSEGLLGKLQAVM